MVLPSRSASSAESNEPCSRSLDWLLDPELRRRVTAILSKGELPNTLARAVCLNRLGEVRDRTFEAQRHRASGLNLVTAAIIL